jgi:threonine synthase
MVATNNNDILPRTFGTGRYEVQAVSPTTSPSMDIQVSSNFERALFEPTARRGGRASLMRACPSPAPSPSRRTLYRLRSSSRRAVSEPMDRGDRAVRREWAPSSIPTAHRHPRRPFASPDDPAPRRALATAHPAKFPDAVERAYGERPRCAPSCRPARPARAFTVVPNDRAAIERHVRARSRVVRGVAA